VADPETDPSAPSGRDMDQPYDGPEGGHGIAVPGRTADEGLRAAMEFAEMIVDTVRDGLLVLDLDLRVQAANESFYRLFGATRDETEGRLVYELDGGVWDRPELRVLLERVLPERHVFEDFEVEHGEGDARRVFHLNGRQLDHHGMVLLAVADVTERVLAREALEQAHQDLEQRVLDRTRQVRALAARLAIAEQQERERIALVLHDDLQQHLFGASIALALLSRSGLTEDQNVFLGRVRRAVEQGTTLARSLAADLSPSVLDSEKTGDVVRWLADRKREMYGLEVTVEGDATVADRPVRFLLYNLVRELLFNVAKHSGADRARVVIGEADGHVVVRVEDEGSGFDVGTLDEGTARGFGLPSVRKRLEAVGGRLDVSSAPGEGTRVTLTVPHAPGD
jgi:PAS domain S-box-containing protein